jgi:hypothetical protein
MLKMIANRTLRLPGQNLLPSHLSAVLPHSGS